MRRPAVAVVAEYPMLMVVAAVVEAELAAVLAEVAGPADPAVALTLAVRGARIPEVAGVDTRTWGVEVDPL